MAFLMSGMSGGVGVGFGLGGLKSPITYNTGFAAAAAVAAAKVSIYYQCKKKKHHL